MTPLLQSNLAALTLHHPHLALRIENAKEVAPLPVETARSGHRVPQLPTDDHRIALHSLFDPLKEALRLRNALVEQSNPNEGRYYLFFEGLGAGFQVEAFMEDDNLSGATVVEHDLLLFKALLSAVDLTDILSHPGISIFVDPSPDELAVHLKSAYLPAVMGGFISVPLRSRVQASPENFERFRTAARDALDELAADLSAQAAFGRLWTRNIALNLPRLSHSAAIPPVLGEAIVAAAGPSLETSRERLTSLRRGRFLIAADTALPTLLLWGLPPDAVLTIDSQIISYRHYLAGLPAGTLVFLELAASPSLFRFATRVAPVAGGHPLSLLAARSVGGIPVIDTSGGNVGHAAVSLSLALGATRVHLFGADFSYPRAKSYARGTHLYDYFAERENRPKPQETGFFELLFRSGPLNQEFHKGSLVYTTPSLDAYRQRFQQAFGPYRRLISVAEGDGIPIRFSPVPPAKPSRLRPSRPDVDEIDGFLERYTHALRELPSTIPRRSTAESADPFSQWELLTTIYPLIAHLHKQRRNSLSIQAIYADARRIALSFFERAQTR